MARAHGLVELAPTLRKALEFLPMYVPNPFLQSADEPRVRRWLLALRILVAASLMLLVTGLGLYVPYSEIVKASFRGPAIWALLIACAAYALSLWWLVTLDERKGMALALGWSPIALSMSAAPLSEAWSRYLEKEVDLTGLLVSAAFSVAQVCTIIVAVRVNRLLPRKPGEPSGLGRGVLRAIGFVGLILLAAAFNAPGLHWGQAESQQRAIIGLRRIALCMKQFNSQHPADGFPDKLAELGPAASGCIGPRLASGNKDGYIFSYTPGPRGPSGRRESFRLIAIGRPRSAVMSLLLNETGAIHYTHEIKDPTSSDPVLP